jgi:hypothetical protein
MKEEFIPSPSPVKAIGGQPLKPATDGTDYTDICPHSWRADLRVGRKTGLIHVNDTPSALIREIRV